MRYKRLKLCAIFLLGLGLIGLQAQENINAVGGNASGSGGSVSYSIGQLLYGTNTGTSGFVVQGVQQTYEISTLTGIAKGISFVVSAYPNPTNNDIKLDIENDKSGNLSFQLYDMNGQLLLNKKIKGNETTIGMSNLAPAPYFIKVNKGSEEIITFKIIKN